MAKNDGTTKVQKSPEMRAFEQSVRELNRLRREREARIPRPTVAASMVALCGNTRVQCDVLDYAFKIKNPKLIAEGKPLAVNVAVFDVVGDRVGGGLFSAYIGSRNGKAVLFWTGLKWDRDDGKFDFTQVKSEVHRASRQAVESIVKRLIRDESATDGVTIGGIEWGNSSIVDALPFE
jgi:hypothetical protein